MTELVRTLYEYAYNRQTLHTLEDQNQYRESSARCKENHRKVLCLLSEEGQIYLGNYIGELNLMHDMDLEVMFQSGLSLGLELSRL